MRVARKEPKPADFRKAQKGIASLLDNYVGDLDFWPKMIKKRVQALKKIFNEGFDGEVSKNTLTYVEKIKKDIAEVSLSFKDIHELLGEMINEHANPDAKKQFLGSQDVNDLSGLSMAEWDKEGMTMESWRNESWRTAAELHRTPQKLYVRPVRGKTNTYEVVLVVREGTPIGPGHSYHELDDILFTGKAQEAVDFYQKWWSNPKSTKLVKDVSNVKHNVERFIAPRVKKLLESDGAKL